MKMHLQTDLSCEISYKCEEKVQISQEAEMLYYELIRALEEEETVRFWNFLNGGARLDLVPVAKKRLIVYWPTYVVVFG